MTRERVNQNFQEKSVPSNLVSSCHFRILFAENNFGTQKLIVWSMGEKGNEVAVSVTGNSLIKHPKPHGFYKKLQIFDLVMVGIKTPDLSMLLIFKESFAFGGHIKMVLFKAFVDLRIHAPLNLIKGVAFLESPFDVDNHISPIDQITSHDEEREPLRFPLDIVSRHSSVREDVDAFVEEKAINLNRFSASIKKCRIVIDEFGQSRNKKRRYNVKIIISVRGKTIAVRHKSKAVYGHEKLYYTIKTAFGTANRKVKAYINKCSKKEKRARKAFQMRQRSQLQKLIFLPNWQF